MKDLPIEQSFYYKNNRLQQLRGFCSAAQYGNVTRASEHMGLSQSSVSLQIKALEQDMGFALFYRSGPKISLTPEGQKLLDMALPLVHGIQNLHKEFHKKFIEEQQTILKIATNSSVKNFLFPTILKTFLERSPTIRIVMHYCEHPEAMELLRSHKVDAAILARHEHLPFPTIYEYMPLLYCKPCLFTLPDHPLAGRRNLTIEEINTYPLVLPTTELQVIPNLRETFGPNSTRAVPIEFINSDTMREYVETGLIITIAPDVWTRPNDTLVATPLTHLFPDTDFGIVRWRGASTPPALSQLTEVMKEYALARLKHTTNHH